MKELDKFIKVKCVTSRPGNPVEDLYLRVSQIVMFGPATEDHAKIGASCSIDLIPNDRVYVTEHTEDIAELLQKIKED